jgi:hypothetical protein
MEMRGYCSVNIKSAKDWGLIETGFFSISRLLQRKSENDLKNNQILKKVSGIDLYEIQPELITHAVNRMTAIEL